MAAYHLQRINSWTINILSMTYDTRLRHKRPHQSFIALDIYAIIRWTGNLTKECLTNNLTLFCLLLSFLIKSLFSPHCKASRYTKPKFLWIVKSRIAKHFVTNGVSQETDLVRFGVFDNGVPISGVSAIYREYSGLTFYVNYDVPACRRSAISSSPRFR